MERIAANNITKLEKNQIFVFGSNLSGRHGKGAAKTALGWGAKWGQAEGLQGRTYGIPTKNASITKTLDLISIGKFVDNFIEFAKNNPELTFLVTEVGTGLAGLKYKDVGPLFKKAKYVNNIFLPEKFWRYII